MKFDIALNILLQEIQLKIKNQDQQDDQDS